MAKSWSWSLALTQAVDDESSVDVPTPGYDEKLADPATVELAIGNVVVDVPEEATVEFNGDDATVTNETGEEWAAGDISTSTSKRKRQMLTQPASWRSGWRRSKPKSKICSGGLRCLRAAHQKRERLSDEEDRPEKPWRVERRR